MVCTASVEISLKRSFESVIFSGRNSDNNCRLPSTSVDSYSLSILESRLTFSLIFLLFSADIIAHSCNSLQPSLILLLQLSLMSVKSSKSMSPRYSRSFALIVRSIAVSMLLEILVWSTEYFRSMTYRA